VTRIIESLAEISQSYDAVFCDLWGCLHNGITAFPAAVAALRAFREQGGTVILLTNAPRPHSSVAEQLVRFNAPDDCWDAIATSGDSARAAMFRGVIGQNVYFIGRPHDEVFFGPSEVVAEPVEIRRTPLDEATGILCCGPFDPHADPAVMRPQFLSAIARDLPLLCANPDVIVDRGDNREWCAGALAALYTEMGGTSLYFGKPHPPVYDLSRRLIVELGRDISDARILCIGDGITTDIAGAMGEDLDSLLITGGLAADQTKTTEQPDPEALAAWLETQPFRPTFAIGKLR